MQDSEKELDKIFLSYDKILNRLNLLNIKTKNGKEVTHKDLRKAVQVMLEKHPTCRWKSRRVRSKRHFILIEGYYWLVYVYFQNEKKRLDADIDFFEMRIKQYEELLNIKPKKIFDKEIYQRELKQYFNRTDGTIKTSIKKMLDCDSSYRYLKDGKYVVKEEGIEWLCKNCFKQKYLEMLETYKMELTEKYIEAGYPYDHFFYRN